MGALKSCAKLVLLTGGFPNIINKVSVKKMPKNGQNNTPPQVRHSDVLYSKFQIRLCQRITTYLCNAGSCFIIFQLPCVKSGFRLAQLQCLLSHWTPVGPTNLAHSTHRIRMHRESTIFPRGTWNDSCKNTGFRQNFR